MALDDFHCPVGLSSTETKLWASFNMTLHNITFTNDPLNIVTSWPDSFIIKAIYLNSVSPQVRFCSFGTLESTFGSACAIKGSVGLKFIMGNEG